jgi:hypothetical protein
VKVYGNAERYLYVFYLGIKYFIPKSNIIYSKKKHPLKRIVPKFWRPGEVFLLNVKGSKRIPQ